MTDKEKYIEIAEKHKNVLPIYMMPWWLNAVAADAWDVVLEEDDINFKGSWVFIKRKKLGMRMLGMPILSTYLGPFLNYPEDQKYSSKLSYEKKVLTELINKLPSYSYLNQRIHHSFTNWLPLYWHGFEQSTRYTYQLDLKKSDEFLWNGLDSTIRRSIRKAENKLNIRIEESNDIELFDKLNQEVFDHRGVKRPYSTKQLLRLDRACADNRSREILFAYDSDGNLYGAIYLVFDETSTYYILGGSSPDKRVSGANSLLMWKAILNAKKRGCLVFDFEGSMIESIEKYFRSFGAIQVPYFNVKHYKNNLFKVTKLLSR